MEQADREDTYNKVQSRDDHSLIHVPVQLDHACLVLAQGDEELETEGNGGKGLVR